MIKCPDCKYELGTNSLCNYCLTSLRVNETLPPNSYKEPLPLSLLDTVPTDRSQEKDHWQHEYLRLTSGVKFYLKNPSKTRGLRVVDIIVPIAEISRYNFHLSTHYSVAEHCYYCSQRCSNPLYALLHDLSEAIIGDLPAPIKVLCPDYKRVELRVEKWIYEVFGLNPAKPPEDMKKVDKRVLATEQLHFGRTADSIEKYPPYMDLRIGCWKPVYAVLRYFERLQELTHGKYTLDTVLEMPEKPDSYFD